MTKTILLSSMLAVSSLAAAPKDEKDFILNPVLRQQTDAGAECLKQLIREKSPYQLYEFEGPYYPRYGTQNTMEYWVMTWNVRTIGHIIKLNTDDQQGWILTSGSNVVETYGATNTPRIAPVYELLRGGDTGYYEFNIDLTPCEKYLK